MAIATLDAAMAGMKPTEMFAKAATGTLVAGRPFNPWYLAGVPGAAVAPTPGLAGAALTSYAGQLAIPAASGNTHLARMTGVSSGSSGVFLLCDRLWHNSGINVTTTTAQTINSAAWPARDRNGSTNGEGVLIGLEVSGATGAGAATPTISYTASDGTAGRTGSLVDAYAATAGAGQFFRFGLQAGDKGVRSVQSVTLGVSMTSGTIHLVAYRALQLLELPSVSVPNALDAVACGLPRCYDTTVPFVLFLPQSTASTLLTGSVNFTQG